MCFWTLHILFLIQLYFFWCIMYFNLCQINVFPFFFSFRAMEESQSISRRCEAFDFFYNLLHFLFFWTLILSLKQKCNVRPSVPAKTVDLAACCPADHIHIEELISHASAGRFLASASLCPIDLWRFSLFIKPLIFSMDLSKDIVKIYRISRKSRKKYYKTAAVFDRKVNY